MKESEDELRFLSGQEMKPEFYLVSISLGYLQCCVFQVYSLVLLKMLHCFLFGHGLVGYVKGLTPLLSFGVCVFCFFRILSRWPSLLFYACTPESAAAVSAIGLVWFVCLDLVRSEIFLLFNVSLLNTA